MADPITNPPVLSGDDENDALQHGPSLLVRLSALLRTGRTYDIANQAFQKQLHDCISVFSRILEHEDEVALVAVADYFYLNGVRIKAQASLLTVYHGLMQEFERRSLGGVRVLQGATPAEFERFFQLFLAADDPAISERLVEAVREASIEHIVPVPALELEDDELTRSLEESREKTPEAERGRARRVFWRAVLGTKKIVVRTMQTGRPDLRHAKRLVQPIVDGIMNHEYSIVGLTALKDHDEYTYAHCVNVSILSVSMGQALGLPRQALADLGVAGLMHDLGKIAVPGDVLRKPAALSAEEWMMMRRHPIEGVKSMIRMPGLSTLMVDTMRVCLEHHMNFDRTGYPDVQAEWGQSTMSRIVAVADCFDAMTAHRVYAKRPRTAFEALQYLFGPARVGFDPAVLWALARTTGLYPPGSVLLTESRCVVIAVSPNPNDLVRPHCRVIVRPDGSAPAEDAPEFWDPMAPSERVARVLRPEEHTHKTNELLAA
ncbi:MAG TPA: HD domain-containing phosphohydrolase [Candidatus Sulfotelmatobacter sp.]|nr:HD domain-containing phosphohydrolase [Candidatus Sulfotelmatobacter sp.]